MSKQLNREEAWALLTEYNQDPFHLHHARTVEGVMRYFAQELGYGDEVDFWGIVGLLHDLDISSDSREKMELAYRQAVAKLSNMPSS